VLMSGRRAARAEGECAAHGYALNDDCTPLIRCARSIADSSICGLDG
jgi:hypothetical protein